MPRGTRSQATGLTDPAPAAGVRGATNSLSSAMGRAKRVPEWGARPRRPSAGEDLKRRALVLQVQRPTQSANRSGPTPWLRPDTIDKGGGLRCVVMGSRTARLAPS